MQIAKEAYVDGLLSMGEISACQDEKQCMSIYITVIRYNFL